MIKKLNMLQYVGVSSILAVEMNRSEFDNYIGLSCDIDRSDELGYLIECFNTGQSNDDRHTGYISWLPSVVFKGKYKLDQIEHYVKFGNAVEELKKGKKVARSGWNGKGMHVELRKGNDEINDHFVLKNAKGTFDTWVPSISDILAEDWFSFVAFNSYADA